MTHEQKPESSEFRTREAQRAALAEALEDGMSRSAAAKEAECHIAEIEARGASGQRREDAEKAEPRTRERLVSDLAARLVADGVLVRIAKEIAQDHISSAVEEGGIAIERTNARLVQLVGHTLVRGDDSVFRRIAIEKRRSDNFLSRYTADASNAHRRCPANVTALEARVRELEGVLKEAARALEQVTDGERGGYNARNGKFVCLRMSDGERADIIHCEVTEDCECALRALRSAIREGGE